jgi:hypothetical protein
VAILLCLLGFSAALLSVQARVDAQARSESVRHVATRVLDLRLQLSDSAADYSHWTEAYERMMSFDMGWVFDNYANTAVDGILFDGLILMGGPFAAPMAWEAGTRHTVPSFLPPATLDRLRAGVAAQAMGTRRTFDMMTVVDGRLLLLSATRVQPLETERLARLNPRSLPISVLSQALGPAQLGEMRAALDLDELSFAPRTRPRRAPRRRGQRAPRTCARPCGPPPPRPRRRGPGRPGLAAAPAGAATSSRPWRPCSSSRPRPSRAWAAPPPGSPTTTRAASCARGPAPTASRAPTP